MQETNDHVDSLDKLTKDHRHFSEYLDDLQEILGFLHQEEAWRKIKPIQDFFQRNIVDHFRREEREVCLPILLNSATPESITLILKLQEEHGFMLKALEEFRRVASDNPFPLSRETQATIKAAGIEIIEKLLAHASEEDDKLFPILEQNRQTAEGNAILAKVS